MEKVITVFGLGNGETVTVQASATTLQGGVDELMQSLRDLVNDGGMDWDGYTIEFKSQGIMAGRYQWVDDDRQDSSAEWCVYVVNLEW